MSTVEERRAARAAWPSAKTTLDEQAEAVGPADATLAFRAVLELTWQSWSLGAGVPEPTPRSTWPSRLVGRGVPRSGPDER